MRMKISFIVPVYNEERNIVEVVKRLKGLPLEKEIIVVDDGSSDGTPERLKTFAGDPDVIVHCAKLNSGKGTAIRAGLKHVSGDIVAIQDGDLEYDVNDYLAIVNRFKDPQIMVVYGSRFTGGMDPPMLRRYRLANRMLRFLANLLYAARITDEATAYKAFRREVIMSIPLNCRRFEFCPEITAKVRRSGIRIFEVPIKYNPRDISAGKKIRARDGIVAVWTLFRYMWWKPRRCK